MSVHWGPKKAGGDTFPISNSVSPYVPLHGEFLPCLPTPTWLGLLVVRGARQGVVAPCNMMPTLRRAALLELLITVATFALHDIDGRSRRVETSITRRLLNATSSEIFHLDLQSRGEHHGEGAHEYPAKPCFGGFHGESSVAAVTIGHPLRRMLRHLKEEGVAVDEALKWTEGEGTNEAAVWKLCRTSVLYPSCVSPTLRDFPLLNFRPSLFRWSCSLASLDEAA